MSSTNETRFFTTLFLVLAVLDATLTVAAVLLGVQRSTNPLWDLPGHVFTCILALMYWAEVRE